MSLQMISKYALAVAVSATISGGIREVRDSIGRRQYIDAGHAILIGDGFDGRRRHNGGFA
jgi:imidazole glycerol phosphate synthase subunit HisF